MWYRNDFIICAHPRRWEGPFPLHFRVQLRVWCAVCVSDNLCIQTHLPHSLQNQERPRVPDPWVLLSLPWHQLTKLLLDLAVAAFWFCQPPCSSAQVHPHPFLCWFTRAKDYTWLTKTAVTPGPLNSRAG